MSFFDSIASRLSSIQLTPLGEALLILLAAFALGKLSQLVFKRWLSRLTRLTETRLDDQIAAALGGPIFLTFVVAGLVLVTRRLLPDEASKPLTLAALGSILLLVWLVTGFRITNLLLAALSRNQKRFPTIQERTIPLFNTLTKVLLLGAGVWALLAIWGIDATPWLTSAGIVGIAVGFAAKDTLANLFSGVFIIADAPYTLGDFIVLDSGERGRVTHVGLRSTRLLTRDDIEVTIPNAVMANSKIVNESGGPWLKERVRIAIGVAYGSDLERVCAVLERVATETPHVCRSPAPRVRMRGFGESSLDFELLCWIDEPVLRGRLVHELNMAVYAAFERHAIEIPFPQRTVHLQPPPDRSEIPTAAARPSGESGES